MSWGAALPRPARLAHPGPPGRPVPACPQRHVLGARASAGWHGLRGHRVGGTGRRERLAHAVPSQRSALSWRFHPVLRALADRAGAEMPPDSVASAGTAIGTRCATDHAHGSHGALPDPGIHPYPDPGFRVCLIRAQIGSVPLHRTRSGRGRAVHCQRTTRRSQWQPFLYGFGAGRVGSYLSVQ